VSARIAGRNGVFRLRYWHEAGAHVDSGGSDVRRPLEPAIPLLFRGDAAGALGFALTLANGPGGATALRSLLAREHATIHRLEDADVVRLLAAQLASGVVVAERVLLPALSSFDLGDVEAEAAPSSAPLATPKTWIEIELVDTEGKPVPNERYWILLPDGTSREGRLDSEGRAYFGGLDPGECDVRFPDLDNEAVAAPGEPAKPKAGAAKPKRARKTWVEIELLGMDGSPIPGEAYKVTLPDGAVKEGRLDDRGRARVDNIDPGQCEVTFPALDEEAWEPA
jgi:hypothetical protein